MPTQGADIYDFIARALTAVWPGRRGIALAFALSIYMSTAYAKTTAYCTQPVILTPQDVKYINSISGNLSAVPAWLIAQLLDLSDRTRHFASSQPIPEEVYLNELLAGPEHYKLRMISVKATFVESSEVTRELQLLPPDRCWSVILLDTKYHQPIQLFTTNNPSRFQGGSEIDVVGYHLANRMDRPRRGLGSQVVVVPVFIGSLLPSGGQGPVPSTPFIQLISTKSFFVPFTLLIFMIIMYFSIKIYVSRLVLRRKSASLVKRKVQG